MERWKTIPDFPNYEASTDGRVRNVNGKILTPLKAGTGYQKVILRGKQLYIHRLVASAWIGSIPDRWEVNHLNSNRTDNRAANLEICTRSDNMQHAHQRIWYETQTKISCFK
jgi:hypothetical protein